jgi:hypothetical protein
MPRILAIAIFTTIVSLSSLFAQESGSEEFKKVILEKTGIEDAGIELDESGHSIQDVVDKIQKTNWDSVKAQIEKIKKGNIQIKKIVLSEQYSIELKFFYSSYSSNYSVTLYMDADKDAKEYPNALIKMLSYVKGLVDEMGLLGDIGVLGCIYRIEDIDIGTLESLSALPEADIFYNKNYFIVKQINSNAGGKKKVSSVINDDGLTADDKIIKIKKILKKKGVYSGQLKNLLELPTEPAITVKMLKNILEIELEDYTKPKDEEKMMSILNYADLKYSFAYLVSRLFKDNYHHIKISMGDNYKEPAYVSYDFILELNIADIFYQKEDIVVK